MAEYFEFQVSKQKNENIQFEYKNTNNEQERLKKIKAFKTKIEESADLSANVKLCCDDESFLSRFLYAEKFQCVGAIQLLTKYVSFKEANQDVFKNINIFDEKIKLALQDGNPRVLIRRDRKGRKIITFAASNWDPDKYSLIDVYRALLLSIDKLLENIRNQALGFVIIVDWTRFNLSQSMHLKPKILKLMIDGLQDCMPVNFKGIHFISQSWYINIISAIIKGFLNEKSKKRLFLHGPNLASLHKHINIDVLPPDLGGNAPNISTLDWYHFLLESSQSYDTTKPYRIIEVTPYSKIPSITKCIT